MNPRNVRGSDPLARTGRPVKSMSRKIGKHRYRLDHTRENKREAQKLAKAKREKGYEVRILKSKTKRTQYRVYVRMPK